MELFQKALHLLAICTLSAAMGGQQPLAPTPPMGWNSWNHFGAKVSDAIIRKQADAMVSSGMRDVGYKYVNIDDGWQGKRDADGVLQPNEHFPDMRALADYVHSKGLKLGIYSSPNTVTCQKLPGSYGHEELDAKTFALWGIDLLKYDLCGLNDKAFSETHSRELTNRKIRDAYMKMHVALLKTGRPIVYSLCQYGLDQVWTWGGSVKGNLWRTTGDINDTYARMSEIGFGQSGLTRFAGPNHWNDADMLEVGNGGMTTDEYKTHMTLWAMLASPLLAGNDLTAMTPETLQMLTNRQVLMIDQDPAGIQGDRWRAEGPFEIWVKPLANGSKAVALFNRQESWMKGDIMELPLTGLGLGTDVRLHDVWDDHDLGVRNGTFAQYVPAHGVVLLKATRVH